MNSIEERAKKASIEDDDGWCVSNTDVERGYIQGAKEQQAIDIGKACMFIRNHVVDFQNDTTDSIDVDALVKALRKEMTRE